MTYLIKAVNLSVLNTESASLRGVGIEGFQYSLICPIIISDVYSGHGFYSCTQDMSSCNSQEIIHNSRNSVILLLYLQ